MIYREYVKPGFDFLVSALFLILFFPLLALVALSIILLDGKPVYFTQERIGKNNKKFKIIKFRTLNLAGKEI